LLVAVRYSNRNPPFFVSLGLFRRRIGEDCLKFSFLIYIVVWCIVKALVETYYTSPNDSTSLWVPNPVDLPVEVNIPNQPPFLCTYCELLGINAAIRLDEVIYIIEVRTEVVEV
jgi:hypothetical protein